MNPDRAQFHSVVENIDPHDSLIDDGSGSGSQYEIDPGVEDFAYAVLMMYAADSVAK